MLPFINNNIIFTTTTVPNVPAPAIQIELDLGLPEEKADNSDGCTCKKCETFYEFAEPNQDDGTLVCWACRHGY
jgi:hypothetical protein